MTSSTTVGFEPTADRRTPWARQSPVNRARRELAVVAVLTVVPQIVLMAIRIANHGTSTPSPPSDLGRLAPILGLAAAEVILVVWLLARAGRLRAAGLCFPSGKRFGSETAWALSLLIAASVVFTVIATGILVALDAAGANDASAAPTATGLTFLVSAVAYAAIAAISEEILCRGYAITRLEDAGWPRAAAFIPPILFATLHLYQGPIGAVWSLTFAAILTVLFLRWRNVWPLAAAHLLWDLFIYLGLLA